ncbi:hypothetical protein N7537_005248 [Penicillium hordei]|uniref:BZIP domain-containing protein n=1 Tax=Penicillium hordei TaxID=40994 RepID=A0AAD6EDA7_9EURO|nr:uncharacterized protein N7537_005248 [Penicillium hordei]KAJ5608629.1 hypothetical protein N7537_005248 [Penicillium hordei]
MQKPTSDRGKPMSSRDTTLPELAYEDDWRHVTNPVERRRRQNRLNQRMYRSRRHDEAQALNGISRLPEANICHSPLQAERHILEGFASAAYRSYMLGCPNIDHLLVLTKANVYRAFLHNISLLGLVADGLCEADVLSPFNQFGPAQITTTTLPLSLRPTPTQRSLPHHPWLDFFPHPKARDNLFRAQDRYDEDEFCLDILGFWNPNALDNMLLVWGEPSDPENWEITEGFIKKWGWVIQGCPEILFNTNKWRARRGENPILRYLS